MSADPSWAVCFHRTMTGERGYIKPLGDDTFVATEDAHPLTREQADELCDNLINGNFLFTDFYVRQIKEGDR